MRNIFRRPAAPARVDDLDHDLDTLRGQVAALAADVTRLEAEGRLDRIERKVDAALALLGGRPDTFSAQVDAAIRGNR